jgi:hypothetical protein
VAFGSSFLNSLYLLKNGPSTMPHISNARWSIGVVQELTGLLLLGYVLSRRSLRFKDLGLRWSLRDVGVGLLVACASYATYAIGYLPRSFPSPRHIRVCDEGSHREQLLRASFCRGHSVFSFEPIF